MPTARRTPRCCVSYRSAPVGLGVAAPAAASRREVRDVGLIFRCRIGMRGRPATVLQEGDAAQAGLALALILAAIGRTLVRSVTRAVAVRLRRLIGLALRRLVGLLAFLAAAVSPALIVAMGKAAHR